MEKLPFLQAIYLQCSWPDVAKSLIVVAANCSRVPPIFTHFSHGNSRARRSPLLHTMYYVVHRIVDYADPLQV